jgi:hypothetical protein
MKKLLVLLLISILAIFAFAGCDGFTPAEGEGEGEGEGEIEKVTVEIDGAIEVGGKTYVSGGNHDIVVTFPAPVDGSVSAYITDCEGNYGKAAPIDGLPDIVLFPNEDKTVWSGSGFFGNKDTSGDLVKDDCCASYVSVVSGECEADTCIVFPVVVDSGDPYAAIELSADGEDCTCGGCDIIFASTSEEYLCDPDEECCGDDCSGIVGWSIRVYKNAPFGQCCTLDCEEPVFTDTGTECPVESVFSCAEDGNYTAIVELEDYAGNTSDVLLTFTLTEDCCIQVWSPDLKDCEGEFDAYNNFCTQSSDTCEHIFFVGEDEIPADCDPCVG